MRISSTFVLCACADAMRAEIVKARGLDQITVEELVTEITPKGRGALYAFVRTWRLIFFVCAAGV
jgi:hypothetical protein